MSKQIKNCHIERALMGLATCQGRSLFILMTIVLIIYTQKTHLHIYLHKATWTLSLTLYVPWLFLLCPLLSDMFIRISWTVWFMGLLSVSHRPEPPPPAPRQHRPKMFDLFSIFYFPFHFARLHKAQCLFGVGEKNFASLSVKWCLQTLWSAS